MATIVIALGGNAVILEKQKGTAQEQWANVRRTCKHIADLLENGHKVVVTHGNGPQVGNLLIQQKEGSEKVPALPMDVCGAMSQGQLGYMLQNCLQESTNQQAVTIVTQVLVDKEDPAFKNPSKPVGPFYEEPLNKEMVYDAGRGYRKVVPSPKPIEIMEAKSIKKLVNAGYVVIASGGGGIPVVKKRGRLVGVEAVIDKDLAAERLASVVKADILLILTAVRHVYVNFRKPDQKVVHKMTVKEAKKYLEEGQFPKGSMGPKIRAAIEFVENGGKKAIITAPELIHDALEGKEGTEIVLR